MRGWGKKMNEEAETLTVDALLEAAELIKALAPKEAPADINQINTIGGLKIMKNSLLPEPTIMVSKRLFDLLFECVDERLEK
jgi:hypothetical protein